MKKEKTMMMESNRLSYVATTGSREASDRRWGAGLAWIVSALVLCPYRPISNLPLLTSSSSTLVNEL